MSSGQKEMVYNTRERVLSTDQNRAQAFLAASEAQQFRRLYNDISPLYSSPGQSIPNTVVGTPLSADVFNGLMVQPFATHLLVQAGTARAIMPAATPDPDDSPYVVVDDPGLQLAGVLTFTVNGGPGHRIDVVECQPVLTVLETDNRDIFDPSTGLFFPAAVTKVRAYRMFYRIRVGTPGAGYPGHAQGWLPLAIIKTPVGAANFDGCDFWDVRPLVTDRIGMGSNVVYDEYLAQPRFVGDGDPYAVAGQFRVRGIVDTAFRQYRAGGLLSSGNNQTFVDIRNVENQGAGFGFPVAGLWQLALLFPHDLPRWVRYSTGSPRVPLGCRGIPTAVFGNVADTAGLIVGVAPAAATGLTALAPGVVVAGGNTQGSLPVAARYDGVHQRFNQGVSLTPTNTTASADIYTFIPGINAPANVRALILNFAQSFTGPAATPMKGLWLIASMRGTSEVDQMCITEVQPFASISSGGGTASIEFTARIPIGPNWPDPLPANSKFILAYSNLTAGFTKVAGSALLLGWEIGP